MFDLYMAEGLSGLQLAAAERQGREYVRRHQSPAVGPPEDDTSLPAAARWRRSLRLVLMHG
jgi:hypothetical protein